MSGWFHLTKLFPLALIALDLCAASVYALYADWRLAIYWISAAILTICVTI